MCCGTCTSPNTFWFVNRIQMTRAHRWKRLVWFVQAHLSIFVFLYEMKKNEHTKIWPFHFPPQWTLVVHSLMLQAPGILFHINETQSTERKLDSLFRKVHSYRFFASFCQYLGPMNRKKKNYFPGYLKLPHPLLTLWADAVPGPLLWGCGGSFPEKQGLPDFRVWIISTFSSVTLCWFWLG